MLSVFTSRGIAIVLGYLAVVTVLGIVLIGVLVAATRYSESTRAEEPQFWFEDPSWYEQREFFIACMTDMMLIEGYSQQEAETFCNELWWSHQ